MRTETTTRNIYTFDELDDDARETAREWFRDIYQYEEWWDCTFDNVRDAAAMLGIGVDEIHFSGFSSQGDGAQFTGSYDYKPGSVAAIRKEWPTDTALRNIAADLIRIQRPWFYGLSARVEHSGHYSHALCTRISVYSDDDVTPGRDAEYDDDTQEALAQALREFMHWIYSRLETEYDWLMSEESVDENIRCNEYEFYSDGTTA